MILYLKLIPISLFFFFSQSCHEPVKNLNKPNVILILADDIGYEGLSINGSLSYKTPNLDSLALNGINFTKAFSQPLCTPSRVKIMTGKYNFKNYDFFSHLNSNEKTIGNLFQESGYKTAVVGKWQLNGLKINEINQTIKSDNNRPNQFGFEEYCLWQLTKTKEYGERFANPLIEENGRTLARDKNAYGPDIVSNYALNFIRRNKNNPFFIYYPMLLVHSPFVPTPDSEEWVEPELRYKNDKKFFVDMVEYMDKIIGKITNELKQNGIEENTLIIFIGDNGTNNKLTTKTVLGKVRGAKGNTITHGVHVPMVVSWPMKIKNPMQYDGLIDLTDFYATFSEILGVKNYSDGISMLNVFSGQKKSNRNFINIYYDPMWGKSSQHRNVFSQNKEYKLYKNGDLFNIEKDILETNPIKNSDLTDNEILIKEKLSIELSKFPSLP